MLYLDKDQFAYDLRLVVGTFSKRARVQEARFAELVRAARLVYRPMPPGSSMEAISAELRAREVRLERAIAKLLDKPPARRLERRKALRPILSPLVAKPEAHEAALVDPDGTVRPGHFVSHAEKAALKRLREAVTYARNRATATRRAWLDRIELNGGKQPHDTLSLMIKGERMLSRRHVRLAEDTLRSYQLVFFQARGMSPFLAP